MDIQTMIYIGLLAALMILAVFIGIQQRELVALRDLIASSPAICFVCFGSKHTYQESDPDPDPMFGPHEYIDSHLVYIPDELLR